MRKESSNAKSRALHSSRQIIVTMEILLWDIWWGEKYQKSTYVKTILSQKMWKNVDFKSA